MTSRALAIGDVALAQFPQHAPPGHEQQGMRPAIVVGLPDALGLARFPLALIAPLTTDRGQFWAQRGRRGHLGRWRPTP